ncbi:MAG: pyridoxamine 5'-phosphate oxidase family protein [Helicobacteraceae bacterium]|jgi:nitroimidazol reductase NimA-like FMN-containing flavoprotein (pyridoxamine 5'-phosphate oxidase superfamily)|nr:pyridoxamine 5'-phosphate oxidase family protein [Helicobacteraceae bacterium]
MEQLRYAKRICEDKEKIEQFLIRSHTGIIGLNAGEYPYAVPVNYIWHKGKIYFHGIGSGKRESLLRKEPSVCFTVYEEYGIVKDKDPWHADTSYFSVMIFGKARKVTFSEEAAEIMRDFVEKFMPGFYQNKTQSINANFMEKYRSALDGNLAAVYCIAPDWLSAKENGATSDEMFKYGESL